jgi:hypothetical protein
MQAAVQNSIRLRGHRVRKQAVLAEQMAQCNAAQSAAEAPEEFAAINQAWVIRAKGDRFLL